MKPMLKDIVTDAPVKPFLLAGQTVPAGAYVDLDSEKVVKLDQAAKLPIADDGHKSVYVPRPPSWEEFISAREGSD